MFIVRTADILHSVRSAMFIDLSLGALTIMPSRYIALLKECAAPFASMLYKHRTPSGIVLASLIYERLNV